MTPVLVLICFLIALIIFLGAFILGYFIGVSMASEIVKEQAYYNANAPEIQ